MPVTDPAATSRPRPRAGAVARTAALALLLAAAAPVPAAGAGAGPRPGSRTGQGATIALGHDLEGPGQGRLRTTAGGTASGAVRVRNLSGRAVTVRLQPADIRNATNGNADYVTGPLRQAGRWLRLSHGTVHLGPGASRRVAFTVRVPRGTTGASHYAGVVAVDARELAAGRRHRGPRRGRPGAGFTIARVNRQALPLSIRIPGPLLRELALRTVRLDVRPAGAGLVIGLLPRGTVLMQSARIRLRVSRGRRTVMREDTTLGQLFPGSRLDYRIAWRGRPAEGIYRVRGAVRPLGAPTVTIDRRVRVSAGDAEAITRRTPPVGAAAVPGPAAPTPAWMLAALAAAGVALVALLLVIRRLARRRPGDPAPGG